MNISQRILKISKEFFFERWGVRGVRNRELE
jgi:hypothetical protein